MASPSEVKESVQKRLEKEQQKLRDTLQTNRRQMKALVESQTMLKRELAEFNVLIQSLKVVERVRVPDDCPF